MNIPGLGLLSDKIDRVDKGKGIVHERSFELGSNVIVFHNIGSLSISDGRRSLLPIFSGIVMALFGIGIINISTGLALFLLAAGIGLAIFGLLRPVDVFLSIGTCDGRRTYLVSKKRDFLIQVRESLREKIDNNSLATGVINIEAGTITGGIAIGANPKAMGAAA